MLPAPTAPSEGSAGVRNLVDRTRRDYRPALDPGSPAQASLPIDSDEARRTSSSSMFRAPSWDDQSQRPALLFLVRRPFRTASREMAIISSGASYQLAPLPLPRELQHCLPAEIGTLGPAAPSCRFRPGGRLEPPSRSQMHHALVRRVGEAKYLVTSLWITWISGTTVGTFRKSAFGCRSVPPRLPQPSA